MAETGSFPPKTASSRVILAYNSITGEPGSEDTIAEGKKHMSESVHKPTSKENYIALSKKK